VVDADGEDGLATLADLEDLHRWLPIGPTCVIGSGGLHLYFTASDRVRNTIRRLGRGLDTRGAGGYAVLPPSIHANGNPYTWLPGRDPWSLPLPKAPDWLLELLDPPQPAVRPVPEPGQRNIERYVEAALEREVALVAGAPAGERNNRLFKAAASMARFVAAGDLAAAEVGPAIVDAAVAAGLPRHEAEATAVSGLRRALT
jgi:hypothetical protein